MKGQWNDRLLWAHSAKSKAQLTFKKTENFNSWNFRQVFTNIATIYTQWDTIRNSELVTVFNRHEECNLFRNIWVEETLAKISLQTNIAMWIVLHFRNYNRGSNHSVSNPREKNYSKNSNHSMLDIETVIKMIITACLNIVKETVIKIVITACLIIVIETY